MKKKLFLAMLVLGAFGYVLYRWDSEPPSLNLEGIPSAVGEESRIPLQLSDSGRGIRSLRVEVEQGDLRRTVFEESYGSFPWPWQQGTMEHQVAISLKSQLENSRLQEGDFELLFELEGQPNLGLFTPRSQFSRTVRFDSVPPQVSVRPLPVRIRQGGADAVVLTVSEEVSEIGVESGGINYRGFPTGQPDEGSYFCIFAMEYNQPTDSDFFAWAVDLAGNRSRIRLTAETRRTRFRQRRLNISERFVEQAAADILPNTPSISPEDNVLARFLALNSELRELNHEEIRQLGQQSADQLLWDQPFLQLSRSQVQAVFADERTYYLDGEPVDQQTHLGFDLASTAASDVEAGNRGKVVLARYFGIYGNCVILDHGLGVMSLYGHLSSIGVSEGQFVDRGQHLGQTGQTGLAAGDHLHFSILVQGTAVNPLEWWDPKWVDLHVLSRLAPEEDDEPQSSG